MAVSAKYQMDKMFFTAMYADRNNIPNDMRSKLMLSSMMPDGGMAGMLSSIVTIDQHKEVLDKNKALEEELEQSRKKSQQGAAADLFIVKWTNLFLQTWKNEEEDEREKILEGIATLLAKYIWEVHKIKSLPESFTNLAEEFKSRISRIFPTLPS